MGVDGSFLLEGASSVQDLFALDAVFATRTPLNCEWHCRFGFALIFFESGYVIPDKHEVTISVAEMDEEILPPPPTDQYPIS